MNLVKKISAVLFFITLFFEFLFNVLILGGYFYFNYMPAFIFIYAAALFGGGISAFIFALKGNWGRAFWFSFIMALILIGCGFNLPTKTHYDFDGKLTFMLRYHLHVIVPCVFAFANWIYEIMYQRKQEKEFEGAIAKKTII
jgi:hypothetical protein